MSVSLTSNFLQNARGITFEDGGGITWSFNSNTNQISANGSSAGAGAGNPTAKVGLTAVNGSAGSWLRSDGAPALSQAIAPTWTATHTFSTASGKAIVAIGVDSNYAVQITGSSNTGKSLGLYVEAGTNSSDVSAAVTNAAGTTTYFQVRGDGTIQGGGPVAGALVDMTPDKGTFTITYTGMTITVTGTAVWARIGSLVALYFPAATGTSNAVTFTATGLPSAIQPARAQMIAVPNNTVEDSGSVLETGEAVYMSGSTATFYNGGNPSGWTASGAKGVNNPFTISYLLN